MPLSDPQARAESFANAKKKCTQVFHNWILNDEALTDAMTACNGDPQRARGVIFWYVRKHIGSFFLRSQEGNGVYTSADYHERRAQNEAWYDNERERDARRMGLSGDPQARDTAYGIAYDAAEAAIWYADDSSGRVPLPSTIYAAFMLALDTCQWRFIAEYHKPEKKG